MNDIIKPFDIDFTKRLHGHVRVETRSRWTGRVMDSQEKDNLVTDAVQKMLMSCGWNTGMPAMFTPIWARALGGLLLFDNTLTEQASNILFPSNAKLVGYAGQGAINDDPTAGSYNTAESVPISNGFTTVWDFLTSQANGTIASLARTSWAFAAGAGWGQPAGIDIRYGGVGTSRNIVYLGYDATNKYVYLSPVTTFTVDGVTYSSSTIYRVKCNLNAVDMTGNIIPTLDKWESFKTLTSSDGSITAGYYTYDKYANNFFYCYSGTTIHVVDINGTHSTKTATGTSGSDIVATENYYWRRGTSAIYKIDKTNPSNVQTINVAPSSIVPSDNDVIYGIGTNTSYVIYPDGAVVTKQGPSSTNRSKRDLGPFYCDGVTSGTIPSTMYQVCPKVDYLGTIANLDSPVTKTSSQTMKITYTLTEA